MKRILQALNFDMTIWSPALILLAGAAFLERFGMGMLDSARTNFFVDVVGLSGGQVLWLEGIREIPGLVLMFIAALTMRLPLSRRGAAALFLAGVGYALYVTVHSYAALLTVEVIASLGIHMWMPLHSSLAMNLSKKDNTGRVMGALSSVGSLASIVGMGVLALVAGFANKIPLGVYYLVGGMFIILAAFFIGRIPTTVGATDTEPPRMLLKRRYWLYYVLTFLQGADKQVLNTFGLLVLVQTFGLEVWQISAILFTSSLLNMVGTPSLGHLLDRLGERVTLSASYFILAACCVGFAFIHNVWILIMLLLSIKLFITLGMGLSTYVYRIAPPEELTPTLSAGISINHVTSVGMPLLAGLALPYIGYEGIFLGTAGLILLSIPFALSLQISAAAPQPALATAE